MEDQELLVQQADGYSCLCRRKGARAGLQRGFGVIVTSYQISRASDPGPVSATNYAVSISSMCSYLISHNRSGYPVNTKCDLPRPINFHTSPTSSLYSPTHLFPLSMISYPCQKRNSISATVRTCQKPQTLHLHRQNPPHYNDAHQPPLHPRNPPI